MQKNKKLESLNKASLSTVLVIILLIVVAAGSVFVINDKLKKKDDSLATLPSDKLTELVNHPYNTKEDALKAFAVYGMTVDRAFMIGPETIIEDNKSPFYNNSGANRLIAGYFKDDSGRVIRMTYSSLTGLVGTVQLMTDDYYKQFLEYDELQQKTTEAIDSNDPDKEFLIQELIALKAKNKKLIN